MGSKLNIILQLHTKEKEQILGSGLDPKIGYLIWIGIRIQIQAGQIFHKKL